ncbi:M20 metallopeptidase family protein [Salinicoccus halodurans]|uniref:Amidohydrolase n=1 Tax=Salinicoccus halodurans TaxID=407035 RepID=A0A0F7HL62_9STAP|nr:amidohydrolase [Salinicoccus halodurans]AKG73594.1 peptidase M20 [Salinicoccus halodurans]SFK53136.1 amidohydrolase [Salinicoccus halodurans]
MQETLFKRLEALYPDMVAFRRDLHMNPELSHHEVETPRKVAAFLDELGLEVKTEVGGRGVTGKLVGGKPGKTVALRADFDALPIQDEKDAPYKSKVDGVMHACGHDVHTAGLLHVAKVLSEHKEDLPGTVVFIHQFAEEVIPGGARFMVEDGCLDGVDAVFGAHVSSTEPLGSVGYREGPVMANGDTFEITIHGKGGHAANPHLATDPLAIGGQLMASLQQIVSRHTDPLKSAVVTVASFNGGDSFNVIPDTANLRGTVRTFEPEVRDSVEAAIKSIAESTCEGFGATAEVEYVRGYPSVVNDPGETRRFRRVAESIYGKENVSEIPPMMGMEDFAYYVREKPGSFAWVGGAMPDDEAVYPHHHPKFDVHEESMLYIGKLFIATVFDYMSNPENTD